jgi:uncharacterized protein YaaW (UPF0174 family)
MNTLQNVYNKLSDKTELAKHEVNLNIIDDFQKERGELLRKNDVDNQVAKLSAITDSKIASFTRLLERQTIVLKQITDLGLTDVANELKKYMALNVETIKISQRTLSILQSIKK